jgi:tRNA (guanine37-N1)-methyltransferase
MRFDILTIFPKIFDSYFDESVTKRARKERLIDIYVHDIRDFSLDKHKKVDDRIFGGGPGMLLTPQPLHDAIFHVRKFNRGPVIFLTPDGKIFTQRIAEKIADKIIKEAAKDEKKKPKSKYGLIFVCGRYEGIDQRIRDNFIDEEYSIGKYVLTGGELPAMVMIDTIVRLLPGVLGHDESAEEETFSKALNRKKEYPHYTRPENFMGHEVPEVLRSGNHGKIKEWRHHKIK